MEQLRAGEIITEHCVSHGYWFEKGELTSVLLRHRHARTQEQWDADSARVQRRAARGFATVIAFLGSIAGALVVGIAYAAGGTRAALVAASIYAGLCLLVWLRSRSRPGDD